MSNRKEDIRADSDDSQVKDELAGNIPITEWEDVERNMAIMSRMSNA